MDDAALISRLARWCVAGAIPAALRAELVSDPLFPVAARSLSRRMLALAAADKAFDGIVKDAGRYLAASWAAHLDAAGGLTLPRLKAFCRASGLLSPGRARAMLIFMHYLGYVRAAPARRGEARRHVPTAALLAVWRLHLKEGLAAASLVEPGVERVLDALDDPEVLQAFLVIQGEGFLETAARIDRDGALIRVFLQRHGGMQAVHSLLLAAPADDAFPPRAPLRAPIAALARRLGVSRTHVRRMLEDGVRAGLLARAGPGAVVLQESARLAIAEVFAARLAGFLVCAAKTARAAPGRLARAPPVTSGSVAA